ncbi:MAG TPA: hypothetical protein PKA54_04940 [Chitinophagaceae bacterium]|nr:hypothetical protein [Chitinophagaceae bacterium]
MKKIFFLLFTLVALKSNSQLPSTRIYFFDIKKSNKGMTISNPQLITKSKGYNNQPYFTPDGDFFYFVKALDTNNIEIYSINLNKKNYKIKQVTHTKGISEYSPKYTPDMSRISCVRVEKDKKTQHFFSYSKKGKNPIHILPSLKTIGYYDWLNQNEFLSFELPEPFYLVKHNLSANKADTIAQNIGRTFYNLRSKGKVVFLDKSDSNQWVLRTVASENLKTYNKKNNVENPILARVLPNEEDYCFTQEGHILMGHEGKLYTLKNPFKTTHLQWEEIADLRNFGIEKFYRLAISIDNTKLAVVAYEGEKP